MKRSRTLATLACSAALLIGGCGDDAGGASPADAGDTSAPPKDVIADGVTPSDAADSGVDDVTADVADAGLPGVDAAGPDVAGPDAITPDIDAADAGDAGPPPAEGDRVAVDLTPYLGDGTGTFARQIATEADLIGGQAATGRVGDYLIGNEHVRFIVQGPSRAIAVCPYGGGLIDGDISRPAGEPGRDAIGAMCVFFNVGRTINGETYEVLSDGSDGGAAVLAVTGRDETLDFINLVGAIDQYVGIPLDLSVNPDDDVPVTLTTYYILRPSDTGVRVVTAIRNDGGDTERIIFGELIDSGGVVEFFNPTSALKGFGYGGFTPEKMDFLAFKGDVTTHAYAPTPIIAQDGSRRAGAGYLVIAGVAGIVLGTDDALGALIGGANPEPHEARHEVPPGDTVVVERWVALGDGSVSSATDFLYPQRGIETGQVSGIAKDESGDPVAGARISAIGTKGGALTQFVSGPDGTFSGALPVGTYTLQALADGRAQLADAAVEIVAGEVADSEVTLTEQGILSVKVTNPAGEPIPAKVTVTCDGPCAVTPTSQQRDITYDFDFRGAIVPLGRSGEMDIPLPPGNYHVVVSRGPEHTLWPEDYSAVSNLGQKITIVGGEAVSIAPVIAQAVDSSGWLSADFHVHAVNSPDAPVRNADRVRAFLAEATDILVATDHDFITDFAPLIADMGAEDLLTSVVGVELTTFDYGHFNAFPLERDAEARNGGAVDWAGGPGYCMHPDAIFDELLAFPGEQVIQVNHPNSGYFFATQLDALTGMTFADPTTFRMAPTEPDPVTGDTKLFSEKFTAVEIYNGFDKSKVWGIMNWWLTFLNRGFRVTGTAVTDTHSLIKDPGGVPRSYVRMPDGADTITPLDEEAFAVAINEGRVVGTNGPLLDVQLVEPVSGDAAGVGETLVTSGSKALELRVTVQTPYWYKVDRIEVISNALDVAPPAGELKTTKPPASWSQDLDLGPGDLLPAFEGSAEGMRYAKTVTFEIEPQEDAYYVVLVSGDKPGSGDLRPLLQGAYKPFAFSNPVFVDLDGDGFTPPLDAKLLPPLPPRPAPLPLQRVPATRELLEKGLDKARGDSCNGGHGMKHEP